MNEQQLIEILWKFVGWSAAAVVALVGVIYGYLVHSLRKISTRVDICATKEELEKVERDLKEDRQNRDKATDKKLDEIVSGVSTMHRRMDDLYKFLLGGGR